MLSWPRSGCPSYPHRSRKQEPSPIPNKLRPRTTPEVKDQLERQRGWIRHERRLLPRTESSCRPGLCSERLCQGRNPARRRVKLGPVAHRNNQACLVLIAKLLEAWQMPDFQLSGRGFPKNHCLRIERDVLPATNAEPAGYVRRVRESSAHILG